MRLSAAVTLLVLAVVAATAQVPDTGAPDKVEVRRSVERTAVWLGDTFRYTLEFSSPTHLDVLAEDLAKDRLPVKGGEIVDVQMAEQDGGSGRRQTVHFLLTTFAVDTQEIVIEAFPVRYFSRRTVGSSDSASAGEVIVPRTSVAIRSTLPDGGRLPELRQPSALRPIPAPVRYARTAGLVLIAIAVVPVALVFLDVAGRVRRMRAGAPRRQARRIHAQRLEELARHTPESAQERLAAFERLDHLVRGHLEVVTGLPAPALTPDEIGAALRARGARQPDDVARLLARCERARYAPDPADTDAWRDAVATATTIMQRRAV